MYDKELNPIHAFRPAVGAADMFRPHKTSGALGVFRSPRGWNLHNAFELQGRESNVSRRRTRTAYSLGFD